MGGGHHRPGHHPLSALLDLQKAFTPQRFKVTLPTPVQFRQQPRPRFDCSLFQRTAQRCKGGAQLHRRLLNQDPLTPALGKVVPNSLYSICGCVLRVGRHKQPGRLIVRHLLQPEQI